MKILQRLFSIILLAGMLFSFLQPASALAAPPQADSAPAASDKIEKQLLEQLTAEGSADFIVRFTQQADLSPAYGMSWEERGWFVYNTLTETARLSQASAIELLDKAGLRHQRFIAGNDLYVWQGNLATAQVLAGLPEVQSIRLTRTYTIDPVFEGPSKLADVTWAGDLLANNTSFDMSPDATTDWGIIDTKADQFWSSFGYQGDGIVVANIDTGVQWDHPALDQSFKCGTNPSDPTCWLDPSNICGGSMCDNNGHGTHTMGTMVADDDPSLTYIAGMAPNAQWIACKGCETNSCSDAALNACADWMLAPGGSASNRPHVVNNSWGGGGGDPWYQAKVQAWQAAGIFPAFSAGNSTGCGSLGSPGDYQESFGTTGHTSTRAHVYAQGPSATFGHDPYTKPNISAPASSICSSVPGNSWSCSYSGTSMASPHSAGAVALLWSCNPSLVGQMAGTFEALQDSADAPTPPNPTCGVPPDGEGTYEDGYGYLNALTMGQQFCVAGWAAIHGTVTDALSTDPIEAVTVTANRQGGGSWSDDTDVTGYYTVTVGAGTYTVEAVHPLYTTATVSDVVVLTDTVVLQDFALQPRGHLFGYVTDQDSGAPLAGTVSVSGGPSTPTDPATGYYEFYLDPGTYDVTASAPDYADESASITLVAGEQEQHDFTLLAAIAVVPDPILITLEMGQNGSVVSQLTNNMSVPYAFEIKEKNPQLGILLAEDILVVRKDTTAATAMENALTTLGVSFLGVTDTVFQGMTVPDLLAYQAVFYAGSTSGSTISENLLMNYLDAGGQLYISDNDLGYSRHGNPFYDTYLQATYIADNGGEILNGENLMAGLTLDVTSDPYPDSFTVGPEGNRIFKWSTSEYAGGIFVQRMGYQAFYTSFDFQQIAAVDDEIELIDRILGEFVTNDIPWFATSITQGMVPGNDTISWTDAFSATTTAGIGQPGEYDAIMRIVPVDNPTLPSKTIPIHMTVEPSANFGQIEGTVTSDRPGGPLLANLLIEATDGTTVTLTTDPATGFYSYWLEAGTYDVTASSAGYVPEATGVIIVGEETTVQDFDLALDAPEIIVTPPALLKTLDFGQAGSETMTITNDGLQPLDFEIVEIPGGAAAQGGGPDPFGYTWKDTNEPGGAMYEWIDATDGTPLGLTDDSEANVTLPFAFNFYGTSSTNIRVGNNGGFIFNVTIGDLSNVNADLGSTTASNIVVPFWDDIDADTGNVYYKTLGTEPHRTFVIEWYNRPHYSNVGSATFELILYEGTNNIKYQYQDVDFGNASYDWGVSATVGIRQTGSNHLQYSFNQAVIQDGMAICFNYPGSPPCDGGDVPWLSEDITAGTIPPGESMDIQVTFDAGEVPEPGQYQATLMVVSNDPLNGQYNEPVTMTVLPTSDLGRLDGTVTSDRPGDPLEAEVLIEASGGMTWTVTTDPDTGYYYKWLNAGSYTATASAMGYISQTVDVIVTGMMTTTQDFELVLLAPEIVVTPPSLDQSLEFGQSAQQTLTISNVGTTPLTYELRERAVNTFTRANTILLMGDDLAAAEWDIYRTALSEAGFTWDEWDLLTLPFPTAVELSAYETLIWTDENTIDPGDADCQVVADWLVSGNKSLLGIGRDFIWDLANGTPGAGEHNLYLLLNTTYLGDYAGTTITTLDGLPGDPIGGDFAPPNGLTLAGTTDSNGDYASIASLATTGLIYGAGGAGSGNSGLTWQDTGSYKTVWLGVNFHDGLNNPDQRNLLMANMMSMLAGGDVPWLLEEPISGTVEAGSFVDITVTFDAAAVPEPGTYLADLRVMNDDPFNNPLDVPVTLNVEPTADLGKLEGTITGLGYCSADSYPLEASLLIEAPDGSSWTVESGPDGYYYQWLYADTYTVTASAPEHLDVTAIAQVSGMMTTTLDLELPYIESCMNVSPTSFSLTLPENSQATELLTIDNAGFGELIWEVHETTRTVGLEAISIPRFTASLPDDKTPVSVEQAPSASLSEPMAGIPMLNPGAPGYVMNLVSDALYFLPDIDLPATWTLVGNPGITSAYAGDFGPDTETLYLISDDTLTLYAVDPATGASTPIGPCLPVSGQTWTGMTWDPTSQTMYASATDGATATLFTVNLATGTTTQVASIAGAAFAIDIAVDGSGQMYTVDIQQDALLLVDKATGVTTYVGSIGFTANYAQGLDYDLDNNILYMAAYNYNGLTGQGEMRIVDTTTGNTTLLGTFPGGAEVDALAVEAGGIPPWNNVPWVTEVPTNGVVGPESSFDVEVTFDTTGLTLGECYTASLGLVHDDPGWATPFYIPLQLCVEEFVPVYGVVLEPAASMASGLPGETITYTLHLTNTGNTADSFQLSTTGVDPLWMVGVPGDPVQLPPGQGVDVLVTVAIPAGAADGEFDTFTLVATSTGDPSVKDTAEITTTVQTGLLRFMLPLVYKD